MRIQTWWMMPGWIQVAPIARPIATTPATTACFAVFGSLIQCSEKTNSAAATR